MKRFALKTKLGEKIALTEAHDLEEAQEKFSIMKALGVLQLLSIFIVEPMG
jgi:hypothetical protein